MRLFSHCLQRYVSVYVGTFTWSTSGCDLYTPLPLLVFSGTAASVIVGRSRAPHTFLPAADMQEYLLVIHVSC